MLWEVVKWNLESFGELDCKCYMSICLGFELDWIELVVVSGLLDVEEGLW